MGDTLSNILSGGKPWEVLETEDPSAKYAPINQRTSPPTSFSVKELILEEQNKQKNMFDFEELQAGLGLPAPPPPTVIVIGLLVNNDNVDALNGEGP